MEKFRKIVLCIAACILMSLPFAVLVYMNIQPEPYGGIRRDSLFRTVSVIFFIQNILALIGQFLMFVQYGDEGAKGCAPAVIGALGAISSYFLSYKGEVVSVAVDYGSYDHFHHRNVSGPEFWIYLVLIWIGIIYSTVMLVFGELED